MRLSGLVFPLLAVALRAASVAPDYNRDIKPILAENCFSCHGFDEKARKAKLRLDVAADARRERNGLTPIKPGDATGSEVWQRLISRDPDEVMPPPDAHRTLTEAQRELIRRWIDSRSEEHTSELQSH